MKQKENDDFSWLQEWFYKNCNGDWEHNTNIKIINLDNPGWSIFINLSETILENKEFRVVDDYKTENDWIYCIVKNQQFKAAGGPFNLLDMLKVFREWAEN
jgi:hypothetical protein